ncbi:MAG TPA: phosphomethylpyrimidine synthase ThiC [Candidatus Avacidaminococcus intestinavium]|uniref:Phosphomethylpyrimidine synthase n=1 Tax=Candidatus Avacidaminococcus intestinavium TaxID=2840684 RepID=A0A9D1MR12_9FIRM|nr:phosphomethylpyrimidine synthase ThiC [Candidatus Avacidaminococcus intestinavium]
MLTQLQAAQQGQITKEMLTVATQENLPVEIIRQKVAEGTVVICANPNHKNLIVRGVGKGLTTKVNANIGTSSCYPDPTPEIAKLHAALAAGADAIMDLSTGHNIPLTRQKIIAASPVMVGTVPIYEAAVAAITKYGSVVHMQKEDFLAVIEQQALDGADFMTIHCGINFKVIDALKKSQRIMKVVSRGGSFVVAWMLYNQQENPFYQYFDDILAICHKYDVVLSLGDGLRPGCIADATDSAQIQELINLGELVLRARAKGVQVLVEGPGHVPLHQIAANVTLQKTLCHNAPFYVLGPLVTDIAPGYDHITSAIGGALAGSAGADFLCYVTPAEHLGLPDLNDVKEGVIAAKIAAHAADLAKGLPSAYARDLAMAEARNKLDWPKQISLAIDPEKAAAYRKSKNKEDEEACSMCGDYCALKIVEEQIHNLK